MQEVGACSRPCLSAKLPVKLPWYVFFACESAGNSQLGAGSWGIAYFVMQCPPPQMTDMLLQHGHAYRAAASPHCSEHSAAVSGLHVILLLLSSCRIESRLQQQRSLGGCLWLGGCVTLITGCFHELHGRYRPVPADGRLSSLLCKHTATFATAAILSSCLLFTEEGQLPPWSLQGCALAVQAVYALGRGRW